MKPDRLLYLSAHQMTAYRWYSGILANEGTFAATDSGYGEFASYLGQHRKSVFSVLVNASEEGFQIETIPFLQGANRRAVITRKLGQLFFNATLTTSASLGYTKEQRKDERILLAALTNNDFFAPWLDAITRTGIALAGVFSVPLLSSLLLKKLKLDDDHFQSLRSYRETRFLIDPSGFEVGTQDTEGHREEKIDLPAGWLRGFMQLQAAMTMPMRRIVTSYSP